MPIHPNQSIFYWARDLNKKEYDKLTSVGLLEDLMLDIEAYFEGYDWQPGVVFSKLIPSDLMAELYVKIDSFAQEIDMNVATVSKALCLYGNYLRNFPSESDEQWWKFVYAGSSFIPSDFQFEFVVQKKKVARFLRLFSPES